MALLEEKTILVIASVAGLITLCTLICCCRKYCKKQHNIKRDVELGSVQNSAGIKSHSPEPTHYGFENNGFETKTEPVLCTIENERNYERNYENTNFSKCKREKLVHCDTCDKSFKTERDLGNHERDTKCPSRRFSKYRHIYFNDNKENEIAELCKKSDLDDRNTYDKCKYIVKDVLSKLLSHESNSERFKCVPDREGSSKIGLKTRKATEFDFSVKILLTSPPDLLWKPVKFEYENDRDSDSFKSGKRDLNQKDTRKSSSPMDIPPGYACVRIQRTDVSKFRESCCRGIFSPFGLLRNFHTFLTNAERETNIDGVSVTVCKAANGPAVKLVIEHGEIKHSISVDITPKIEIPASLIYDHHWPRNETEDFLSEDQIQAVLKREIYLVPKGDKYWAISFANYENAVINIFKNQSTEKKIIRCMKVQLERWQAQSQTLRDISSYIIKVMFLWLREQLPEADLWEDDVVAERYNNFLHELKHCFRDGHLKSYFLPDVDLLQHKSHETRKAMIDFLQKEINNMKDDRTRLC